MARDTVQTHHDRLFKFFLDFFDYRRLSQVHEKAKKDVKAEKEVASVEDSFIDAFLHMVMKLSELSFKPLFLRVTHWIAETVDAKAGEAQSSTFPRLFTFWRLANALADKLKSIFVPYYGYLLDDAVAYLTNGKDVFGEKEESEDEESDEDAVQIMKSSAKKATTDKKVAKAVMPEKRRVEQKNEFLSLIMASLHKCFLYDAENFITADKFDRLVPALVAQIENNTGSLKEYQARVTDHLIPAIAQLAINVGDDKLWKSLNHQVLLTTRSSAAPIRFAGLKVVEAFYQRLGEEFLPLLPETVPFLAELMEDSAMEVEQLCQEVIALINKYLPEGESIASYFQ
jgi:U3 small nucleolar RNA-associated protein 10